MPLVKPYCTVAQVQKELRNSDADAAGWLEDCINAASRYVDDWRGRDYWFHDHASSPLVIRGAMESWLDDTVLELLYSPIITLTRVAEGSTVLVAETGYVIRRARAGYDMENDALIRIGGSWLKGYTTADAISLTGTFGYYSVSTQIMSPDTPPNINKATILIAAAFSTMDQKDIISADGMRDRIATKEIPRQVAALLGPRAGRVLV